MGLSLGIISKLLNKGKAFIKNKLVFLILAGFLRKVLMFSGIKDLSLVIKHIPLYLQDILNIINSPVINTYKNPYNNNLLVDETFLNNVFYFNFFLFYNNKSYTFQKSKKKGRIKRKISKRVIKLNRVVD
jgi:hypothetical protein